MRPGESPVLSARLWLWRKQYLNLLEVRNTSWEHLNSAVLMYGCESWTVKKAECWKIDASELWWWRLLRVPWTARRSNQSILKEISPRCSLEGLRCWSWNSNTWATSCKELTHWKRPWCWEGLGAGGEGNDRGWDGWMASPTRWAWVWVNSGGWWWTGRPSVLWFMGSQRVGHDWATELKRFYYTFIMLWNVPTTLVKKTEENYLPLAWSINKWWKWSSNLFQSLSF